MSRYDCSGSSRGSVPIGHFSTINNFDLEIFFKIDHFNTIGICWTLLSQSIFIWNIAAPRVYNIFVQNCIFLNDVALKDLQIKTISHCGKITNVGTGPKAECYTLFKLDCQWMLRWK